MKNKYTWDDLYKRADGAACGEDTLKAKDEARWQVRCFVMECNGKDLEKAECPEDEVEHYCNKYEILFNERGSIIETSLNRQDNKKFTDDDLYILSDGLLALIRNTNCSIKMTYGKDGIETLEKALLKYQELNKKVCSMLK